MLFFIKIKSWIFQQWTIEKLICLTITFSENLELFYDVFYVLGYS